jgi:hypothetical protein
LIDGLRDGLHQALKASGVDSFAQREIWHAVCFHLAGAVRMRQNGWI